MGAAAAPSAAALQYPDDHPPPPATRLPVKLHRRVCLVQTEDALLAEELLARKKLAQDVAGRLTDTILLVRPGRGEAARKGDAVY